MNGNFEALQLGVLQNRPACVAYLLIFVYFYQDAVLIRSDQLVIYDVSSFAHKLAVWLFATFPRLEIDQFQWVRESCVLPDSTPVMNVALHLAVIAYVLVIFLFLSLVNRFGGCLHVSLPGRESVFSRIDALLASGFLLAWLCFYQRITMLVFRLLNCVAVDNTLALFVDGTLTCYQPWQYGVLAYALSCLATLSVVLMCGPRLLANSDISLTQFFCACVVPPPFLLYWFIKSRRQGNRRQGDRKISSRAACNVIWILQGAFKPTQEICWAGVLTARRLVLVLIHSFVNNALLKLVLTLLLCFFVFLHHANSEPYRKSVANAAGTVSAAAHVVICTISLVEAAFQSADYQPTGPNDELVSMFLYVQNLLIVWIPSAIVALVLLAFIGRLFRCCVSCD